MMRQRFVARLRCSASARLAFCVAFVVSAVVFQQGTAVPQAQGPVTFSQHVAPILFANCTACHRPGEAAPFQLMNYRDARPLAKAIAAATASRVMPPWKAGPGDSSSPTRGSSPTSRSTIIQRWVADGALEGDAEAAAGAASLHGRVAAWSSRSGRDDERGVRGASSGPDVYRSFVVPLNLDRDVWVRAIDFSPSARAVVHHSLFFLDATGARASAMRMILVRDSAAAWAEACGSAASGAVAVSPHCSAAAQAAPTIAPADPIARVAGGLGGWALGGRALELPNGLAFPLPKGSDLILSTHFHPSGKAQMEKSTVGLYFASGPPTQAFTTIQLPPLFSVFEGLDIPAGQERYTLQDSFVIPIDVKAFSVGAHAHYLGKEMKLTATLPDGAAKTLLWIKDWDFSWQERYRFKDFVSLPKGTRLDADGQLRQLGGEQAESRAVRRCAYVGRGVERRDGQHRTAGRCGHSRRAAAAAAGVQRPSAHGCDDAARVSSSFCSSESVS